MNRVELAPRAHAQVRLIHEWWRGNRLSAPTLPRSRYHVFYSVDGNLVKVRAVWHASRGKGPPLR